MHSLHSNKFCSFLHTFLYDSTISDRPEAGGRYSSLSSTTTTLSNGKPNTEAAQDLSVLGFLSLFVESFNTYRDPSPDQENKTATNIRAPRGGIRTHNLRKKINPPTSRVTPVVDSMRTVSSPVSTIKERYLPQKTHTFSSHNLHPRNLLQAAINPNIV